MSKPIQHIAVMRLSAMGDVAMIVPVLRAFTSQYPNVKLTIVSRPFFRPFFDNLDNLNFFPIDLKNRHKGLLGLFRLFFDLNSLQVDAFADLHNVLRSQVVRVLFTWNGKKVAYSDKGRSEKKALTRSKNKIFKPLKSMFERHADAFQKLGFPIDLANPIFPEKAILSEKVESISGKKQDWKWIGIAPFAQYEGKVYPIDLMQQLLDELGLIPNYKIFLFGGGNDERQLLDSLVNKKENRINVAGKLSLNEELQLISNLDIMISMDSGNGHIAAMLGVHVITLWGATHPFAGFSPYNQPEDNSIVSDRNQFPLLPTSVYGNKIVPNYKEAMRTITTQTIIETVIKNIDGCRL